ncbi:MAG: glycosyl hydrolase, partial [Bacteroidia bacterium]|nr:glycosyl hydrolase [Bacteroidia bacterium]
MKKIYLLLALTWGLFGYAGAQKKKDEPVAQSALEKTDLSGLKFRNVGPAITSGRISDFAVNPHNPKEYYVAVSSGGVWKTVNAGTTFTPLFDSQGSYSIGCVSLDPNNPDVVWVGTGENNNQRSVAYGDGVYKSEDGGQSWTHRGLANTQHIGRIVAHPQDTQTAWVASIGSLYSSNPERGVFKTTDGGKTWEKTLFVNDSTGIIDLVINPQNPDQLWAAPGNAAARP